YVVPDVARPDLQPERVEAARRVVELLRGVGLAGPGPDRLAAPPAEVDVVSLDGDVARALAAPRRDEETVLEVANGVAADPDPRGADAVPLGAARPVVA